MKEVGLVCGSVAIFSHNLQPFHADDICSLKSAFEVKGTRGDEDGRSEASPAEQLSDQLD